MPDISGYLVDTGSSLWEFMTSHWFLMSILAIRILLPKIIDLFKRTMGR